MGQGGDFVAACLYAAGNSPSRVQNDSCSVRAMISSCSAFVKSQK